MSFAAPIGPKSEFFAPPANVEMFNSAEQSPFGKRLSGNKRKAEACRFIPSRDAMRQAMSQETYACSRPETLYQNTLVSQLFPFYSERSLLYRAPKPFTVTVPSIGPVWEIPKAPSRTLDIPEVKSNFFYNNLDWGKTFVGFNIKNKCYAYSNETKKTIEFFKNNATLCSLKWSPNGEDLACGDADAILSVCNVERDEAIEFENVSGSRICSLDWRSPSEITLGSHAAITHFDLRSNSVAWRIQSDPSWTCSIKWNDGKNLLATGNRSSDVRIFDIAKIAEDSLFHYSHQSGIKALQWNPEQPSWLMSGGGKADRTLKLFDTERGRQLSEAYVNSQICSLSWLDKDHCVIGLGFHVENGNNLQYWRYLPHLQTLNKVGQVSFQKGRILDLAKDHNSSAFCSSSDKAEKDTLCFWEPTKIGKIKPKSTSVFDSHLLR